MSQISLQQIKNVKRIITHASCPDGIASAMILHQCCPDAELSFVQYNTPQHLALSAEPGLLFCDMTPPRHRVAEFVAAESIVLDHHKGAEDIVTQFGELGVFADEKNQPGVSGAVLAYRSVYLPLVEAKEATFCMIWQRDLVAEFSRLVGIRDTWQRDSPDWRYASEVCAALIFLGAKELIRHGAPAYPLRHHVALGAILLTKNDEYARAAAAAKHMLSFPTIHGLVAVTNRSRLISDIAEEVRQIQPSVAIVVGFFYEIADNDMTLVVSLRSCSDTVDVSKIAKANGGGGHTKAAGFRVKTSSDPVLELKQRLGFVLEGNNHG